MPTPPGSARKPAEESQDRRAGAQGRIGGGTSKAAVLSAAGLVTREARWMVPAQNLAAVLDRAAQLDLRQLWIGPETAQHLQLAPGVHPWLGEALRAGWMHSANAGRGLAPWVALSRERAHVELAIPSWEDRNPFGAACSAGELLEALELFSSALRLRYRWSPGNTGLALMRAVHAGPTGVQLPEQGTPAPPALEPAEWLRGSWMAEEERWPALGWLHAFDVNGMFLAACSSIELGFGAAIHHKPYLAGLPTKAPGFFRASVRAPRSWAGWVPFVADGKRHWYPGPAVDLLAEAGARVTITEAWTYPERHRWLTPWYERLRDARAALVAAGGPGGLLALDALKRTYSAALGRLAGSWMAPGDAAFRPDWRLAVIARAFANLQRHLLKVQAHSGELPLARDADLVVYASTVEAPEIAAGVFGLELDELQLGKWKPAGSATIASLAGRDLGLPQVLQLMGAR